MTYQKFSFQKKSASCILFYNLHVLWSTFTFLEHTTNPRQVRWRIEEKSRGRSCRTLRGHSKGSWGVSCQTLPLKCLPLYSRGRNLYKFRGVDPYTSPPSTSVLGAQGFAQERWCSQETHTTPTTGPPRDLSRRRGPSVYGRALNAPFGHPLDEVRLQDPTPWVKDLRPNSGKSFIQEKSRSEHWPSPCTPVVPWKVCIM